MTGAPKPIPAHQWPKDNWHTPVVYQILTDANWSQCTPTPSVKAVLLPNSQPSHPKTNPGTPFKFKFDQMSSTYQGQSSVQTQVHIGNQVYISPGRSNLSSLWTPVARCPKAHTYPNHQLSQPKEKRKLSWMKEPDSFMIEWLRWNHTAARSDLPNAKLKCIIIYLLCILNTLKEILQSFWHFPQRPHCRSC